MENLEDGLLGRIISINKIKHDFIGSYINSNWIILNKKEMGKVFQPFYIFYKKKKWWNKYNLKLREN